LSLPKKTSIIEESIVVQNDYKSKVAENSLYNQSFQHLTIQLKEKDKRLLNNHTNRSLTLPSRLHSQTQEMEEYSQEINRKNTRTPQINEGRNRERLRISLICCGQSPPE